MKIIKNSIHIYLVLMLLSACSSSDFLNILPKDQLTVPATFTTYDNVRTYAWQFYDALPGYEQPVLNSELNSDLMLRSTANSESTWIWQRVVIPSSAEDWSEPYTNIRTINIMLDNLDNSQMNEADKDHWRAVGYFFR